MIKLGVKKVICWMFVMATFTSLFTINPVEAVDCNRCSVTNGCERTFFTNTVNSCDIVEHLDSIVRITDCKCTSIAGGNNSRCESCPSTRFIIPNLSNASQFETVPTYEGSGQAVHPDVIYFPNGWQDYKYWLLMLPYPEGDGAFENPSILASNDGESWVVPGTNPITPPVDTDKYVQSDSDMLVVNGILYVYYRINDMSTSPQTMILRRVSSTDGKTWTAPVDTSVVRLNSGTLASPAIIYENSSYYLFYVDTLAKQVKRLTSIDGLNWQNDTLLFSFPYAWHLDVVRYEDHYLMLLVERLSDKQNNKSKLYYLTSEDMLDWVYQGIVLSPSDSGWDSGTIYRSTFMIDGSRFRVWYSAFLNKTVYIGYAEDSSWTYTASFDCNRCSMQNGCERTQFQPLVNDCAQPIPGSSVIRTTDCSCSQVSQGDNSRCIAECSTCVPIGDDASVADLITWYGVYRSGSNDQEANFDCENGVDIADLVYWYGKYRN